MRVERSQNWVFPHFSDLFGIFLPWRIFSNAEISGKVILLGCTSSPAAVSVPGWALWIPNPPESPASEADVSPKTTDASWENHPVLRFSPSLSQPRGGLCLRDANSSRVPALLHSPHPASPLWVMPLLLCSTHIPSSTAFQAGLGDSLL